MINELKRGNLRENGIEDNLCGQIMEISPVAILVLDREGRITHVNAQAERLLGINRERITDFPFVDCLATDHEGRPFPADQRPFRQVMSTGRPVQDMHAAVQLPDGKRRLLTVSAAPVCDVSGRVERVVFRLEDVTERVEAEKDRRKSEENFRSIFANAPVGIYQSTAQRLVSVNPVLAQMFGYGSPEEMVASSTEASSFFVHPEQRVEMVREAMNTDAFGSREVEYRRKDGTTFFASLRMRAVRDEAGGVQLFEGFVEDITGQKHAAEKLRESEEKFRQLAENIQKVFWICDRKTTKMLYVSPAYEKIWGLSCQSLYDRPFSFLDAIHPEDRPRVAASLERHRGGGKYEEKYRIVRPDGSIRWIHDRGFVVRNDRGEFYRRAGLAEDITQRRLLEAEFLQSQKMEAIGHLAGGVAHDFNNILAASLMHLGLLQQSPQLTMGAKESLKEVEKEIMRASKLTRQLLLFGRRQAANMGVFDLNTLINELLKMLRRLLGENIEVLFKGSGKPIFVRADAGMIEQVVMNLCINARDAMPRGGKLTITIATAHFSEPTTKLNSNARPGRFACLTVADTGCGIDPAYLERIFEPFFTTKGVGQGSGLGLATVYGIIKQHEGWVEVESTVGKGSSFRVYLPGSSRVPDVGAIPMSEEARGGSETILLVEDDLSVRRMAALSLRKSGYGVLEAANGAEALKVWERDRQKIDLLVTDMVMPGELTGRDVAERLLKEKPSLKVVLSSGYSDDLVEAQPLDDARMVFLPKPYSNVNLARTVRRSLDGKSNHHFQPK